MSALIVSSIITGTLYTLLALGLVMVFKTTGVLNFAHGLLAALCGYVAYTITVEWHQPFVLAVVVATVAGVLLGTLMEIVLLYPLRHKTPLELVIATFAVSLFIEFVITKKWGFDLRTIPIPFGARIAHVLGIVIPVYGAVVFSVALVIIGLLTLMLLKTSLGLRLRATFDEPIAVRLAGVSSRRVRLLSWAAGGGLAGLAGALIAPLSFLSPSGMNTFLIIAFAAAVVGGFSSLGGTAVGGIAVAAVLNFGGFYISLRFRNVILYLLIVVFLWMRPTGIFSKEGEETQTGDTVGSQPRWARLSSMAKSLRERAVAKRSILNGRQVAVLFHVLLILLVLLMLPILGPNWRLSLGAWLINTIAVFGLALMIFYSGQFSLAQNATMGIGGYFTAHVVASHSGRWPLAVILSTLAVAVLALVIAIPSSRVKGPYFAALTLALGLTVPELAYNWPSVTGGSGGIAVSPPTIGSTMLTDGQVYWIIMVITLAVYASLITLRNSAVGRRMIIALDAPDMALTMNISPTRWRIAVFVAGSALGGLAGSLSALQGGYVSPVPYGLDLALLLFVATIVGGSITGAFWGTAIVTLIPVLFKGISNYSLALQGAVLVAALFFQSQGLSNIDRVRRLRWNSRPHRLGRMRNSDTQ